MPIFEDGIRIFTRDEWGAASPSRPLYDLDLPMTLFYTVLAVTHWCREEEDCKKIVKEIQIDHMRKGYPDIQYNFLVGADGNAYEGVGWNKHVLDMNREELNSHQKVIIAFIGKPGESRYYRRMLAAHDRLMTYGFNKKFLLAGRLSDIPDIEI